MEDHYEFVTAHVNNLAIASKDPKAIADALTNIYGFKLKGAGPIQCHLGMTFRPRQHVNKMVDACQHLFGAKPSPKLSPLNNGDHPKIDESDFLDEVESQKHQPLI